MATMKTMDELLAEYEPERLANLALEEAKYNSPEAVARRAARRDAEKKLIEREIADGLRRKDGSLIEDESDDEADPD